MIRFFCGQIQSSKFDKENVFWLAYRICWFWLYSIIFNISGMNPIIERIMPIKERVFVVCHSNSWTQKSKMYNFFNKFTLLCLELCQHRHQKSKYKNIHLPFVSRTKSLAVRLLLIISSSSNKLFVLKSSSILDDRIVPTKTEKSKIDVFVLSK